MISTAVIRVEDDSNEDDHSHREPYIEEILAVAVEVEVVDLNG